MRKSIIRRLFSATVLLAVAWSTAAIAETPAESVERGRAAIERGKYAKAWRLLAPIAEEGNPDAQNAIGVMTQQGWGVKPDAATAAKWYRAAAEQGHPKGQFNLGRLYDEGKGAPQDFEQAVAWYRKAADQGYALGQSALGAMYATGDGVEQDYVEAIEWYLRAARQGEPEAQRRVGMMYAEAQGVEQDYAEAEKWFREGALQGHAGCQFWLGRLYENGWGVKRDYDEAASWYRLAAEQGMTEAMFQLNLVHMIAASDPQDDDRAREDLQQGTAGGGEAGEGAIARSDGPQSDLEPWDLLAHQFTIDLPSGWHASIQSPGPYGVVAFSAESLFEKLEGEDEEALEAIALDLMRRLDSGELPSFFVDRMKARRGMSCARLGERAKEKKIASLTGEVPLGRGSTLLQPPQAEVISVAGCQGLRVLVRARTLEGWEMMLLVYSVTVENVTYDLALRNRKEHFEKNLPVFERSVATLRFPRTL